MKAVDMAEIVDSISEEIRAEAVKKHNAKTAEHMRKLADDIEKGVYRTIALVGVAVAYQGEDDELALYRAYCGFVSTSETKAALHDCCALMEKGEDELAGAVLSNALNAEVAALAEAALAEAALRKDADVN